MNVGLKITVIIISLASVANAEVVRWERQLDLSGFDSITPGPAVQCAR